MTAMVVFRLIFMLSSLPTSAEQMNCTLGYRTPSIGIDLPRYGDCDSHVESPINLGLAVSEAGVPIRHSGILTNHEPNGVQIARHLPGRPCADLRLADQTEDQAGKEPAMRSVVVDYKGRSARAPPSDSGEGRPHDVSRQVHHHAFPDPASRRGAIVAGALQHSIERLLLEIDRDEADDGL